MADLITPYEKEVLNAIHESMSELTKMMSDGFEDRGVEVTDIEQATAAGTQLAMYDALFAIREGTEWRGITDAQEIARQILRDTGIGE